jgi:putative membrane protein
MLMTWGPGWGLFWGLIWAAFWIAAIIIVAVWLLRGDFNRVQHRFGGPPALRLLEERYARGEISREEFLERRAVLLQPPPQPPAEPPQPPVEPTEPIPPPQPSP